MTQLHFNGRREFRNQTTVWTNGKAEVGSGKGQRSEEKKKEDQKRERVRRKKTQVREKGEKSRIPMFFQMTCGSGGSKIGSLKRGHLGR